MLRISMLVQFHVVSRDTYSQTIQSSLALTKDGNSFLCLNAIIIGVIGTGAKTTKDDGVFPLSCHLTFCLRIPSAVQVETCLILLSSVKKKCITENSTSVDDIRFLQTFSVCQCRLYQRIFFN